MLVRPLTEHVARSRDSFPVRRGLLGLACVAALGAPAHAEKDLYERLWPRVPDSQRATLGQQLADSITELGNTLGYHAAVLSNEMIAMKFDGRRRRAYVRLGAGDEQFLNFRLASDVQFIEGLARVNTKIDLSFRGRKVQFELPEMEMVPTSYRGDRGVEVRVPIYRRTW